MIVLMNLKTKFYLGEILLLLFSILSSFLLFPLIQKIVLQKPILDLDIYDFAIYILIIILPVIFMDMMKNSISYSVLCFWSFNILAMLFYIILYKTGGVTNIIEDNFYFVVIIYIIMLSVIQSSMFYFIQKYK